MSIIKNFKLKKVAKKHSINFAGRLGLAIDHNVVSNFNYLLEHYSGGELWDFDDRSLIHKHKDQLLKTIDEELRKDALREQEALKIGRKTAEANLKNLKKIIVALSEYHEVEAA
ncbi:MAG: hypothetical protein D6B27_10215 [Gammaproteobacteria bacterium]|nr:MAG: hypothetical protein D6B27_10215 [Gammaproteobacteria bacterium]